VKPFLFVTDLDHTLVGNDRAMSDLNHQLEAHRQQYGTKIVYSTGRSLTSYRQLSTEKTLLQPDILICAVGTEIYHQGGDTPDPIWSEMLSQGWKREHIVNSAARFVDLTPQPDSEQRPFKVSYFLSEQAAIEVLLT
jgi:sucrose-6F-phosphate phosphohydrolase